MAQVFCLSFWYQNLTPKTCAGLGLFAVGLIDQQLGLVFMQFSLDLGILVLLPFLFTRLGNIIQ